MAQLSRVLKDHLVYLNSESGSSKRTLAVILFVHFSAYLKKFSLKILYYIVTYCMFFHVFGIYGTVHLWFREPEPLEPLEPAQVVVLTPRCMSTRSETPWHARLGLRWHGPWRWLVQKCWLLGSMVFRSEQKISTGEKEEAFYH